MIEISIPTSREASEQGANFIVFCANMVDELALESDDIPTLAGIIEYRVVQSQQFSEYVDLVARVISRSRVENGKTPLALFYQTKANVRENMIKDLRAKLPSDILEAKMRLKAGINTTR